MPSHRFRFIVDVSRPADAAERRTQRRQARSHATRQQHAKTRELRTMVYQSGKPGSEGANQAIGDARGQKPTTALSLVLPSDRRDPFGSFAAPFGPVEHFLLDHFVTAVIPAMRCPEAEISFADAMGRCWVPFALSDATLLKTLFLTACRHLCHVYAPRSRHRQDFDRLAVLYKLECIRSVRDAIAAPVPPYSLATVGTVVMLAYDELFIHDNLRLQQHVEGAVRMVELNGGVGGLGGVNGLMEHLLRKLLKKSAAVGASHVKSYRLSPAAFHDVRRVGEGLDQGERRVISSD